MELENVAEIEVEIQESGPAGEQGPPGLSAYEVYLVNGGTLSEKEWLESLKGETGQPGSTPVKGEDYFTEEDIASLKIPTKVSDLENDSGFISKVPEEYITETELEEKGYTTEKYVDDAVATLGDYVDEQLANIDIPEAAGGEMPVFNISSMGNIGTITLMVEADRERFFQYCNEHRGERIFVYLNCDTASLSGVYSGVVPTENMPGYSAAIFKCYSNANFYRSGVLYTSHLYISINIQEEQITQAEGQQPPHIEISQLVNMYASYAPKDKVLLTNGTTAYTPTSDYHPATKKYVDDAVANIDTGNVDLSAYYTKDEADAKYELGCEDGSKIARYHLYGSVYTDGTVGGTNISTSSELGQTILAALQDAYDNRETYPVACFILHSSHYNGYLAYTLKCYYNASNFYNNFVPRYKYTNNREVHFAISRPTISNGIVTQPNSNIAYVTVSKVLMESDVITKNASTAFTPTSDYHPATKKYVDDAIAAIDIPESSNVDLGDTPTYHISTNQGTNMLVQHIILNDSNVPEYGTVLRKAINAGLKKFVVSIYLTGHGMTLDVLYTIGDDGSISIIKINTLITVSSGSYIEGYSPVLENMVTSVSSLETATMYLRVQHMNSSNLCPIVENVANKTYVDEAILAAIGTVLEAEY